MIFPGIIFTLCFGWPAIERLFTKDTAMHNLLDRPRDRPKRTAAGAAMIALLFTCFGASATDVLANFFHVSLNGVLWTFRILVFVVPIVAGFVTWKICLEMQHGGEGLGQRKRAMVVTRTAAGEYLAVPAAVRPGDEHAELEAVPVPTLIDLDDGSVEVAAGNTRPDADGVRRVIR